MMILIMKLITINFLIKINLTSRFSGRFRFLHIYSRIFAKRLKFSIVVPI